MKQRSMVFALPLVIALGACAAKGFPEPVPEVETEVGLLLPALSTEAHALGIAGWEIRQGAPGTQITALTADARPAGTILFTSRVHEGVQNGLFLAKMKLGDRGHLAYLPDGTMVANTMPNLPGALSWLEAAGADLAQSSVGTIVPYAGGSNCDHEFTSTALSCTGAAVHIARCAPAAIATYGAACLPAAPSIFGCLWDGYTYWECESREADPYGVGDAGEYGGTESPDPESESGGSGSESDEDPYGVGDEGEYGGAPDPEDDYGIGDEGEFGGSDTNSDGWEDDWGSKTRSDEYGGSDAGFDNAGSSSSGTGGTSGEEDAYGIGDEGEFGGTPTSEGDLGGEAE